MINDFTGPGWYLDVFGDSNEAIMSNASSDSGMLWQLQSIATTTSSSTTTAAITTSTSPTTAPAQASSSSVADGLSTGAKAGIGVGAVLVALMLLGVSVAVLILRKKRKRQQAQTSSGAQYRFFGNERRGDNNHHFGMSRKNHAATIGSRAELLGESEIVEIYSSGKPAVELNAEGRTSELPGH